MRWRRRRARPVVVFFDEDGWNCFLQLAAALRRAGARAVCVQVEGGGRRALIGRFGYGPVLRAGHPGDLRRLQRLVDGGVVVDVHVNELNLARLDGSSRCAGLLRRMTGPGEGGQWWRFDKLEVSERLAAGGVAVPPFRRLEQIDDSATGDTPRLAYPLMVKQRISSGGAGVMVAANGTSLTAAVSALSARSPAGSPKPPVFVEQFLPGQVVQYAALIGAQAIEQEVCLLVVKGEQDPYGPSVGVVTIDDPALLAAGRRAVRVLGCTGLVNLEFMRDPEGGLWHIDLSARAYGNIAALSQAGADMIGWYLWHLGLARHRPPPPRPVAAGRHVEVFPTSLLERKHAVGTAAAARALVPEALPYLRAFGARYLLAVAVVVADARIRAGRRRRQERADAGRVRQGQATRPAGPHAAAARKV